MILLDSVWKTCFLDFWKGECLNKNNRDAHFSALEASCLLSVCPSVVSVENTWRACRVYPVHLTVHTEFVFGNRRSPAKLGHLEEQHVSRLILLSPLWISFSNRSLFTIWQASWQIHDWFAQKHVLTQQNKSFCLLEREGCAHRHRFYSIDLDDKLLLKLPSHSQSLYSSAYYNS